jgi:hypothetical protein
MQQRRLGTRKERTRMHATGGVETKGEQEREEWTGTEM